MSDEKDTHRISLGRETFIGLSAKGMLAIFGFVGVVVFYDTLGQELLGVYYSVLAVGQVASQIPSGVNTAVHKRVSEVGTDAGEYFGIGLVSLALTLLIASFTALAVPGLLLAFVPTQAHLFAVIAIIGSLSAFTLTNRLYSAIGYPGLSFWTDAARSVLTLGAQLTFLWFGYREFGLVAGFVGATAVSALCIGLMARVRPRIPSRASVNRVVSFAKWSVPTSLMGNLYQRVDVLIISAFVGFGGVGIYEPALRLTVPASFVAASIGQSLSVKASGLSSIGEEVFDDLENAVSYTCLFALPMFFGVLSLSTELMRTIYGPSATEGAMVLVGLALFQVFNSFRLPFDRIVEGVDRPELQLGVSVATLLLHVPLAIALSSWGVEGVVAATVIAEAVRTGLYQLVSYRLFGQFAYTTQVSRQFVSAVVMYLALGGLQATGIVISGWPVLLLVVGFGGIVYFATLILVSQHFRSTVGHVVGEFV